MSEYVYLDYAASTPIDPRIAALMADAERVHFANPSSLHGPGRRARLALEAARKQISTILGAKPREITFTSGSTESIQRAIGGVLAAFPDAKVAVSQLEHEAVLHTVPHNAVQPIVVQASGVLTVDDVSAVITDETVLVCAHYVNNETGAVQPIAKIAAFIKDVRTDRQQRGIQLPLYLYVDAAQAGLQTLAVDGLGADLLSMGGSKLYGPRSAGFLYIRTDVALGSAGSGGERTSSLRLGTPHVAGAIGLAAALERMQRGRSAELYRLRELEQSLLRNIGAMSGLSENGDRRHCYPGIINLTITGLRGEDLVAYLDAARCAVATGSACAASSDRPSHVLLAMGLSQEMASSSLRISLGRHTTTLEVKAFSVALIGAVARLRHMAESPHHSVQ